MQRRRHRMNHAEADGDAIPGVDGADHHRQLDLIGGVALLVGFGARPAALVLALFTLVASYFFHGYWRLPADQQFVQQLMFFKNVAVAGGLLLLAAWGAGAWSIDARRTAAPAARRDFSFAG